MIIRHKARVPVEGANLNVSWLPWLCCGYIAGVEAVVIGKLLLHNLGSGDLSGFRKLVSEEKSGLSLSTLMAFNM
jgi:hypothetical protein